MQVNESITTHPMVDHIPLYALRPCTTVRTLKPRDLPMLLQNMPHHRIHPCELLLIPGMPMTRQHSVVRVEVRDMVGESVDPHLRCAVGAEGAGAGEDSFVGC